MGRFALLKSCVWLYTPVLFPCARQMLGPPPFSGHPFCDVSKLNICTMQCNVPASRRKKGKKKIERESRTTPLPPFSFIFIILSAKVSSKSYIKEAKLFQNKSLFPFSASSNVTSPWTEKGFLRQSTPQCALGFKYFLSVRWDNYYILLSKVGGKLL